MAEEIKVIVAEDDYRAPETAIRWWDKIGDLMAEAEQGLGRDMAYSVILSRIARELRRELGVEAARTAFQGFADTMDKAAPGDRP